MILVFLSKGEHHALMWERRVRALEGYYGRSSWIGTISNCWTCFKLTAGSHAL